MVKILFLGANARNTTRLQMGAEVSDIKDEIAKVGARDAFPVEAEFAVRPEQLQSFLLHHKPEILHFSGHGSGRSAAGAAPARGNTRDLLPDDDADGAGDEGAGGIVLEDKRGIAVAVRPEALTELIEIVRRGAPLRCVVLNACFTLEQARDIAQHVDGVIGMKRAIDDASAIAFAVGFYRALAQGESVKTAFDFGCNEIALRGLPDKEVPALVHRSDVKPEGLFLSDVVTAEPPRKLPLRDHLRRAAPFAAVLLCTLVAAALFLPLARVEPVSPESGALVVAGPWLSSSQGRAARHALCEAIERERKEGEPRLLCLDLPRFGTSEEALRQQALSAGASLLVLVDAEGTARLRPLGPMADDAIVDHGLPRVELSPSHAPTLAPVVLSLAHLVRIAEAPGRLRYDWLRCTPIDATTPRSVLLLSLLTGMFASDCRQEGVDAKSLRGACAGGPSDSDACKLAIFLYVNRFPRAADATGLREALKSSSRLWPVIMAQAARSACRSHEIEQAKEAMRWFWEDPSACVKLMASSVAACVLSERTGGAEEDTTGLADIEAFAETPEVAGCPEPLRASALAERAFWRAQEKRWSESAMDYAKAYALWPTRHAYGLNRVEVLLHQGQAEQAIEALRALRELLVEERPSEGRGDTRQRKDLIHEALLRWIAERRAGRAAADIGLAAARLVDLYRSWPEGASVFAGASDTVLRPLACADGAPSCAYDVLAASKTSSSEARLEEALAAAPPLAVPRAP